MQPPTLPETDRRRIYYACSCCQIHILNLFSVIMYGAVSALLSPKKLYLLSHMIIQKPPDATTYFT